MKEMNLLQNNVQLHTETSYMVNGDIRVYVCPWNQSEEPMTEGAQRSYPARITVMETGEISVKAYRIGSQGPRYRKVFRTEHCEILKAEGGQLIERWKFAPHLSVHDIWQARQRETPAINAYYLTLQNNML